MTKLVTSEATSKTYSTSRLIPIECVKWLFVCSPIFVVFELISQLKLQERNNNSDSLHVGSVIIVGVHSEANLLIDRFWHNYISSAQTWNWLDLCAEERFEIFMREGERIKHLLTLTVNSSHPRDVSNQIPFPIQLITIVSTARLWYSVITSPYLLVVFPPSKIRQRRTIWGSFIVLLQTERVCLWRSNGNTSSHVCVRRR